MRELTDKEMTLISGGDLTTVQVTADIPPGGDPGGGLPGGTGNPGSGGGGGGFSFDTQANSVTAHQNGNVVTLDATLVFDATHTGHVIVTDDLSTNTVTLGGSYSDSVNNYTLTGSSAGSLTAGYAHAFNFGNGDTINLNVGFGASGYTLGAEVVVPF